LADARERPQEGTHGGDPKKPVRAQKQPGKSPKKEEKATTEAGTPVARGRGPKVNFGPDAKRKAAQADEESDADGWTQSQIDALQV
jgi:hypothetical protein